MRIKFDPESGKLTYNGKEVGEHSFIEGKSVVRLNIEYHTEGDWIAPLSWLAYGLTLLPENRPTSGWVEVAMPEDAIETEFDVPRSLLEKKVKRGGYIWKFHKSDPDQWPSELHGHDYDKGLKLDVLTGSIYDVGTGRRCKTLKPEHLLLVQSELRASNDFKEIVERLIPSTPLL
jgi:hypothetical protein